MTPDVLPPRAYGRAITWIAFSLTAIGVLMIYSASTFWGAAKFDDPAAFLKRQLVGVALGVTGFLLCARLPVSFWSRRAGLVLLSTLALLALVLVAGSRFNGARRWIRFLGFGFQPTEFAKLAVVVWAAAIAVRKGPVLSRFREGFIPAVLPVVAVCGLTLLEPDFGTCLFLGGLGMLVLILGGLRLTHLMTAGVALVAVVTVFMLTRFEYIRDRIGFFAGEQESYQVRQAFIALGSGGLAGRGIGAGAGKLFFLPEVAGDFIFPSIGEEIGFLGVCLVVSLFMAFVWCGYRISRLALPVDRFAFLLGMGLTAWVGFQAVVNLAVVSGSAPTKGIALPFISYGSSSLVVCLAASGILLSVARAAEDGRRVP
jgi:cell division protein FtsW